MTILERIADWISGGALTRAERERIDALVTINRMARNQEAQWDAERAVWHRMRHAIRSIAACETPGANATVRRMARIAREALE